MIEFNTTKLTATFKDASGNRVKRVDPAAVYMSITQKFYKSLNRNSYNLALLSVEDWKNVPLKGALTARSSYSSES